MRDIYFKVCAGRHRPVIERQPLPYVPGSNSHYRIVCGVVVMTTPEDFATDDPLFERFVVFTKAVLNNVSEKVLTLLA
jgi:hypothetical protein